MIQILNAKNKKVTEQPRSPSDVINADQLKSIRDDLILRHAELIVRGLQENQARDDLKEVVREEHSHVVRGNDDIIDYIVQETVGTGIVEEIIKDESITDMKYNGSHFIIEGNDIKEVYRGRQNITEDYIVSIVTKFAQANGREFSPKNPIFDGSFKNIRINAVHKENTTSGTTMSLRVVRPRLALTKDNFENFAPNYMLNFFEQIVKMRTNIIISGETGTGKTELQKLLASFIKFEHTVALIEEVAETFIKQMFPDKDILSWVTSPNVSITDLVKAALRNNVRWILVSETRGQEAYEMIQAVLSGHHIITTLHAVNAMASPTRLVNMAKMGYRVSEESLKEDIKRYFNFGIHIKRVEYKGKVLRYLSEMVEYGVDKDTTVFKQRFVNGKYIVETGVISDELKERFEEENIVFDFPEKYSHKREANSNVQFVKIPILQ